MPFQKIPSEARPPCKIKVFRGISREVTAKALYRQNLEYLSMHDSLTGLHNRAFFEEELKRLQVSRDYPVAIIYIDVNNMKVINDALGHGEGDNLLKSAAKLLKQFVRSSDLLTRIGGDEFVLILTGSDEKAAGSPHFQKIFIELLLSFKAASHRYIARGCINKM